MTLYDAEFLRVCDGALWCAPAMLPGLSSVFALTRRINGEQFAMKKFLLAIFVATICLQSTAKAGQYFGVRPEGAPSVLNYGWDGLHIGFLTGCSIGYLQYLNDRESTSLIKGAGYSAIGGVCAGIVMGMKDASDGKKGMAGIMLRDLRLGADLGLVVGVIYGGIRAIDTDDAETLGECAAWGVLGGELVGLAIALFEGPIIAKDYSQQRRTSVNLVFLNDAANKAVPALGLTRRF